MRKMRRFDESEW